MRFWRVERSLRVGSGIALVVVDVRTSEMLDRRLLDRLERRHLGLCVLFFLLE